MTLNDAIEQSTTFITNGDKTFCIKDKQFYDVQMNQVVITNTDELFIDNWELA
jgi:hypothetical protein